jgi:uncharacterized protein
VTEVYHRGEIAVQELADERGQAVLNGHAIADVIPPPARPFVGQQSVVAIGWRDPSGAPWASVVVGEPGFARADDTGTAVSIHLPAEGDDLFTRQPPPRAGDAVGLIVIDLATKRRLRVNGVVVPGSAAVLRVAVEQAFANCPKYIQRREPVEAARPLQSVEAFGGTGMPSDLASWLARTDTAFVASVGPDGRLDCSHRGGRRGYLRMDNDAVLVPDYQGNSMYCTLGNLVAEPRAGLVLVDFDARQQLHLSGDAHVEVTSTGRQWRLAPRQWAVSPLGGPTAWRLVDESPFNPPIER